MSFTGLMAGQSYLIQNSLGLNSWSPRQAFTALGPSCFSWDTASLAGRRFYRLAATDG